MDFIFVSTLQKSAQIKRKDEEYRPKSTSIYLYKYTSKIGPFQALIFYFSFANAAKFRDGLIWPAAHIFIDLF
jgi:hypothetical protein